MDNELREAARAMGRKGGKVMSVRKLEALRVNGRKGGLAKGRNYRTRIQDNAVLSDSVENT